MDVIKVEKRNEQAKANQLRRSGLVPCCVYGGDLPESISIQMDQQTANKLFHTKREDSQVGLELDGRVIPAQIKEKKKMMSGQVEHFGFQALSANKKVNSVTHIFLKNTELVPGTLEQMLFEVPFASLPADMIDTVTVDLDGMPAGTTLTVKDIPEFQSDKIELQIDADRSSIKSGRWKRMPKRPEFPSATQRALIPAPARDQGASARKEQTRCS